MNNNHEDKGTRLLTVGESRVRTNFNVVQPGPDRTFVDTLKQESAKMINLCQDGINSVAEKEVSANMKGEAYRLWALAQTHYEEAAMWAVKAATMGL